MDKIVGVVETRSHLRELLSKVAKGARYIIVQRSKAKAVLVSPEEMETLEVMADRELLRELVEAKSDIKAERYLTYKEYFREPRGRRNTSHQAIPKKLRKTR